MELNYKKLYNQYCRQKAHAKERGIDWQLTFEEWLQIWIDSGHLAERGKKSDQYCMARVSPDGVHDVDENGEQLPYSWQTVKIITNEENKSVAAKRDSRKRVADGSHNLLGGENSRKRVADGSHHLLGGELQRQQAKNGNHPSQKRMKDGTHNFLQEHQCPHCSKIGKGPNMFRWHFDNCKHRQPSEVETA